MRVKELDNFLVILSWISQSSIIIGGVLSVYWFQYTEEGKKFWRTKIKNLNMKELNDEEQGVSPSKIHAIKNGSLLLKLWLLLYLVFFTSIVTMVLIAITT